MSVTKRLICTFLCWNRIIIYRSPNTAVFWTWRHIVWQLCRPIDITWKRGASIFRLQGKLRDRIQWCFFQGQKDWTNYQATNRSLYSAVHSSSILTMKAAGSSETSVGLHFCTKTAGCHKPKDNLSHVLDNISSLLLFVCEPTNSVIPSTDIVGDSQAGDFSGDEVG